jgi:putative membrane protein
MSKILFIAYLILFAVCAIEPYDRAVWLAENVPVLLVVVAIAISNYYHKYSNLALMFMAVFITLHTIGGHYTFERVPFDWFTDTFGFERNHYDRIAHFSVGFYAFPLAEILKRNNLVNTHWLLYLFPLFTIISVGGVYELLEWQYAISADPEAGIAVLGSQGDIWDAQKDILSDTLGALFSLLIFKLRK